MKYRQGQALLVMCIYPPRVITTNNLLYVLPEAQTFHFNFKIKCHRSLGIFGVCLFVFTIVCISIALAYMAGLVEHPVLRGGVAFLKTKKSLQEHDTSTLKPTFSSPLLSKRVLINKEYSINTD